MNNKPPFDWIGFWVQFFFGAIFGTVLGFGTWAKSSWKTSPDMLPGICFIGGGALIFGVVAGLAGDRFWADLGNRSWWRWW
jgi:hypothetical protein